MYSMTILFNDANNTDNILLEFIMIIHIKCNYLLLFYYLTTYLLYFNNFCDRKNRIKNEKNR